jgi:hypothetical protein
MQGLWPQLRDQDLSVILHAEKRAVAAKGCFINGVLIHRYHPCDYYGTQPQIALSFYTGRPLKHRDIHAPVAGS